MQPPPVPRDEAARLDALAAYEILDSPPEEVFDDLVRLAAHVADTPVALVSLVDEHRQWFKAKHGTDLTHTEREISFCGHVVAGGAALVVPDAFEDPRFHDNPLVKGTPPVRFYAGMPLTTAEGYTLGTLCAIDHRPRELTAQQLKLLQSLARLTMHQMDLRIILRKMAARVDTLSETGSRLELANRSLSLRFGRLATVLDRLETGVLVSDETGTIIFTSDQLGDQLGISASTLSGTPLKDLPDRLGETLTTMASQAKAPGARPRRLVVSQGSASPRDLEISVETAPDSTDLLWLFHDVTELRLHEEDSLKGGSWLLGDSPPIRRVRRIVQDLGRGTWSVLIEGETGTGKELAAHAIHDHSDRRNHAFLAVNCAGLTESLLTSQLFGHRKGSFTGAFRDQAGLFEAADGGTLFLDEVGDMPLSVQALLLRTLETGEILRVGDDKPRKVDVRIIAATNHDVPHLAATGVFREDLLYRLRVGRIRMPALRERREDIGLLLSYFLAQACTASGRAPLRLDRETSRRLQTYSWPGNVRELRHCVDYLVIHCHDSVAQPEDLPPEVIGEPRREAPSFARRPSAEDIEAALKAAGGNRSQAAKILGVSRATLYRWMATLSSSASK